MKCEFMSSEKIFVALDWLTWGPQGVRRKYDTKSRTIEKL